MIMIVGIIVGSTIRTCSYGYNKMVVLKLYATIQAQAFFDTSDKENLNNYHVTSPLQSSCLYEQYGTPRFQIDTI